MDMKTGNEPINPTGQSQSGTGLTMREHYAGLAMQGVLSDPSMKDVPAKEILKKLGRETIVYEFPKHYSEYVSIIAVAMADALIAELNKTT